MYKRNPTSWKQRWSLERGLTVLIVSGIFLCITEVIGTAEVVGDPPPAEDVCLTPECNHIASIIRKNMDPDVNPCDDFYQFACGGFLNSTVMPSDKEYVSAISSMEDKLKEQLRTSIEEASEPNERKSFRLVKSLYNSCMNTTAIENRGLEPLRKILEKLGGWPVLNGTWDGADFDWKNTTYKLHDAGYSADYFMEFGMSVDWENETRNVLALDTAKLGLPYEYLSEGIDNPVVIAYYSYMVDIAVLLGAERERANTELLESLLFEINLANISLTMEEQIEQTLAYNLMTLYELRSNFPSIPWREYFSKLLPKNITVEENELAIVFVPSFISDLEKLLLQTPRKVQANYMIWRTVQDSVPYLNEDIRKRELAYLTVLNGQHEIKSRWQECIDIISHRLPIALGAMYVRKYTKQEANQYVVDMMKDIKNEFYKIFQQVEWMDENMRQRSINSVATISGYVAHPDEFLDNPKVHKLYENLEISGENYFDSMLNLSFFNTESSFGKLREPANKFDWVSHSNPTLIQASYVFADHIIDLPAGLLQDPLFSFHRPSYINYGNIGFVISNLIAHSFAFMVQDFSKNGNLSNWTSLEENYLKRIECIIHQYGNYTDKEVGLPINGKQTQDYNVADNAGIKAAYLAYTDWAKRHELEQKLPGLPYSPNQMFWIGATVPWCTKHRLESLRHLIEEDFHSPPEFRILGMVSNMPQFAKDFSCPLGSKMNPEKKCSVW